MRFFFVYEKEKLSHIIIWRSFSDEVHGEKDIKIGKLFTAKSLSVSESEMEASVALAKGGSSVVRKASDGRPLYL